jgi:hypothetical protein
MFFILVQASPTLARAYLVQTGDRSERVDQRVADAPLLRPFGVDDAGSESDAYVAREAVLILLLGEEESGRSGTADRR